MSTLLREADFDGVREAKEAVEIADRLAASEPTIYRKSRVDARDTLARALEAAHQPEKTLAVLKEMINIHRAHVPKSGAPAKDVMDLVNDLVKISRSVLPSANGG